jgi:hypothetical protein
MKSISRYNAKYFIMNFWKESKIVISKYINLEFFELKFFLIKDIALELLIPVLINYSEYSIHHVFVEIPIE